jgi:flagellar motor protein MotB
MQIDKEDSTDSQDWMLTYSDLMSLLLCLFVMLFAISTTQTTKIEAVTESLRGGFGLFGNVSQAFKGGTIKKTTPSKKLGGTILFNWGSDDLSDEAKQQLNVIYQQLLATEERFQIVGQAGLGEPSAYRRELDLAYSRAINVWDYLVSLGMSRERCQVVQQTGESKAAIAEIQMVP